MIVDYHNLRNAINNSHSKYKDLMKIAYLFCIRVSELLPEKKGEDALKGKNFFMETIDGEDALTLDIPTRRQDGKPRSVSIPLHPPYEDWSKDILDFCEKKHNQHLYNIVSRTYQQHVHDEFKNLEWYESGYFQRRKGKKWQSSRIDSLQTKHFKEIREWELALNHKLTPYEIMNFCGYTGYVNDKSYFRKLLKKSDIYMTEDVTEAVKLNRIIFNPADKLSFNTYMEIQKFIKKGLIIYLPIEKIAIDDTIKPAPKKSGEREHQLLKSNIKIYLESLGSRSIEFEKANLDVIDYDKGIAIECGNSDGRKLLDVYNNVYDGIFDINEFWVLDYYNEDNSSNLYKFKLIR